MSEEAQFQEQHDDKKYSETAEPSPISSNVEPSPNSNEVVKQENVQASEPILIPVPKEEQQLIQHDIAHSQQCKLKGNQYFKDKQYAEAVESYEQALKYIVLPKNDSEQLCTEAKLKATIYSNLVIVLLKQNYYEEAIKYGQRGTKLDKKHFKLRANLAQSYEMAGKPEEALAEYQVAYQLQPEPYLSEKLKKLQIEVDHINEKRKEEVISGLKSIGNSVLGYFGMSLDNFKMQKNQSGNYNISFQK